MTAPINPPPDIASIAKGLTKVANCTGCGRAVYVENYPVTAGFIAECGRRLIFLEDCVPGGCTYAIAHLTKEQPND